MRRRPRHHDVVDLRAGEAGAGEGVADFDTLRSVDAQHRLADPAVQLAVPVDVRAEADRDVKGDDLQNAAERVAGLFRLVDRGDPMNRTSDIGAMELYASSVISSDPFAVARVMRERFAKD